MNTHVHLLIETPEANLGIGMHRLHGDYASWINRRRGRRGHLFERRYGAVGIESDAQLHIVAAYIALNPVAAGICRLPEDWPWSSHRTVVSGSEPAWLDAAGLVGYFGAFGGDGRKRYVEFTESAQLLRGLAPL